MPFEFTYGQLLLAAAAANLAAALLQVVLALVRVKRSSAKTKDERQVDVSVRVELRIDGEEG